MSTKFSSKFKLRKDETTELTPTEVTKLQTAHFTDLAPYWYIKSILQLPQLTCAT
ncbi:unnamed protein product [Rhodiola kirilowii]